MSGGFHKFSWEGLAAVVKTGGHDGEASFGDAITPATTAAPDVAMGAQDEQLAPGASRLAFANRRVFVGQRAQPQADVFIAEPLQMMLTP